MSEKITIQRTGDRALSFSGDCLAEADTHTTEGFGQSRWHKLALYQTEGGRYIVAVGYRTQWQGELPVDWAWTAADEAEAVRLLRAHDPMAGVMGFPPGRQYEERQERLQADLRLRYDTAVSEVLQAIGPEEVE